MIALNAHYIRIRAAGYDTSHHLQMDKKRTVLVLFTLANYLIIQSFIAYFQAESSRQLTHII